MRIERRYTKAGEGAYAGIEFRTTKSEIRNPDGSVVFKLDGIDVPAAWSQVASDILAQKYFRKAGVPARLKRVEENDVPSFLWRSVPDEAALAALPESERHVSEHRFAPGLRPPRRHLDLLGLEGRLLRPRGGRPRLLRRAPLHARHPEGGAQLAAMVQHRPALGLRHRWSEPGPLLRRLPDRRSCVASETAYEHPQPHACFIQGDQPTTSSTRAASWTCGCARRASSSTARAPAPTSRSSAARARSSPAAAARPA